MRAAIYVRQSINNLEGIERGLALTREMISNRGWTLVHEYSDNETSGFKSRKGTDWDRMLEAIRRGEIEVVVSVDMDRLMRSQKDLLTLIDLGVKVLTLSGELDLTTADGEHRATQDVAAARFEVRRKSERQKRANVLRVELRGMPVPSRRRYGYESDGVTVRESEAVVVRRMFEAFHGGASIRSIVAGLKADGIEPTTGVEWGPRRIRDTLNSRAYAGDATHKGKVYPGLIHPIVDPELAAEVRLRLADPSRRTTPGSAVKHLLSNVAFCGVCGSRLIFMRSYICRASPAHVSILKPLLDEPVRGEIVAALQFGHADMLGDPVSGATVSDTLRGHASVLARIEETQRREDEGLLTEDQSRARLTKLRRERLAIEAALEHAKTTSAAANVLVNLQREVMAPGRVDLDGVVQLRDEIGERFDALDIEQQRELLRSLLRVTVHKGRTSDRIEIVHTTVTSLNSGEIERERMAQLRVVVSA